MPAKQKTAPRKKAQPPKKVSSSKKGAPQKTLVACPGGGEHQWTTEGEGVFCQKCHEPEPAKGVVRQAKRAKLPVTQQFSAVDAAAKLLSETPTPLNCKELIAGISAKGYWCSPGGKTPHSTLYAAILREMTTKGAAARFVKAAPGKFALKTAAT